RSNILFAKTVRLFGLLTSRISNRRCHQACERNIPLERSHQRGRSTSTISRIVVSKGLLFAVSCSLLRRENSGWKGPPRIKILDQLVSVRTPLCLQRSMPDSCAAANPDSESTLQSARLRPVPP